MNPRKGSFRHMLDPLKLFLDDSRSVGIVLILCTLVSLFLSNAGFSQSGYLALWEIKTPIGGGVLHLPENLLLWINDALMAVFFLQVGMEIKKELTIGELSSLKKSLFPVFGALGGMVVPALIYFSFNGGTPFHHGWGIPMATDIAFSLGVLALLGSKAPLQLKVFLAALAIIDDLGAILVIAIFYSSNLSWLYLIIGLVLTGVAILLNRAKVKSIPVYIVIGILMWYCILNSGIHATIAGVLLSMCIPIDLIPKIEKRIIHFVNFVVMPLFALANTAIIFPNQFGHIFESTIAIGVVLGLIIGKPVGVMLFTYLSTKLNLAALPSHTGWRQMFGVALLAGIGFTMSIFISTLAFDDSQAQDIAKIAVLAASLVAGICGFFYIKHRAHRDIVGSPDENEN